MHAAGIKRVFWTTQDGGWEGAKVGKLIEALESGGDMAGREGVGSESVFVTKHEVLMIRRVMGF